MTGGNQVAILFMEDYPNPLNAKGKAGNFLEKRLFRTKKGFVCCLGKMSSATDSLIAPKIRKEKVMMILFEHKAELTPSDPKRCMFIWNDSRHRCTQFSGRKAVHCEWEVNIHRELWIEVRGNAVMFYDQEYMKNL